MQEASSVETREFRKENSTDLAYVSVLMVVAVIVLLLIVRVVNPRSR